MACKRCGYSPDKKNRSNSQNRYYWGCVLPLVSDHTGFTIEEAHEVLKYKFLKGWKNIKNPKKEYIEVEYVRSTTSLDTKSFEEYMTKVREFASADMGLYIPEPNEDIKEKLC